MLVNIRSAMPHKDAGRYRQTIFSKHSRTLPDSGAPAGLEWLFPYFPQRFRLVAWPGIPAMSDVKFGTWSAQESPVAIEYSLVVIEEIRQEVTEGFQKLSRGGVEVGGALYGTRDGRSISIQAMRPILCEHARGPAFILS